MEKITYTEYSKNDSEVALTAITINALEAVATKLDTDIIKLGVVPIGVSEPMSDYFIHKYKVVGDEGVTVADLSITRSSTDPDRNSWELESELQYH